MAPSLYSVKNYYRYLHCLELWTDIKQGRYEAVKTVILFNIPKLSIPDTPCFVIFIADVYIKDEMEVCGMPVDDHVTLLCLHSQMPSVIPASWRRAAASPAPSAR